MYTNTVKIIAMSALALVLIACGGPKDANKGNFGKAIQNYLNTKKSNGLCFNVPTTEKIPFQMGKVSVMGSNEKSNALVDAGLLSKRAVNTGLFGPGFEYQITDLGKKYFIAKIDGRFDAFCTGKYTSVEIDNFTNPARDMRGMTISQVNFHYKLTEFADWAKTQNLIDSYHLKNKVQDDISEKADLVLTNDGWVHERLFNEKQ